MEPLPQLIFADIAESLVDAWRSHTEGLDFITCHHGSIFDLDCDAIVSPANSFGFMDGGIDALYSHYFGWHVEERLQTIIREKYHGELLVGQAEIVPTDHPKIPFLISAPTMRVPMVLRESVNPYLATRAVLLLWKHGIWEGKPLSESVHTIAFPGLGTGVGRVGPQTCAYQMRAAIDEVLLNKEAFPQTWVAAQSAHLSLFGAHLRDMQKD
jgi:O-acetyl-ADP-ribose deacetylase (regulator of RNase III)